jgi:hypothetical protein
MTPHAAMAKRIPEFRFFMSTSWIRNSRAVRKCWRKRPMVLVAAQKVFPAPDPASLVRRHAATLSDHDT